MKRFVYPIAALALMTASAFTFIASQDWKINDDYTIKFTSHDPSGTFAGLKGTVAFDENDLAASKFDVTIDVATINTGNGMKNNHAKSARWFDAEKYPTIGFKSTGITKTSTGYTATGALQIHGVTRDFVLPFNYQKTDKGGLFTSSFEINRLDYNVNTEEPEHGAASFKVDISVPVSKP